MTDLFHRLRAFMRPLSPRLLWQKISLFWRESTLFFSRLVLRIRQRLCRLLCPHLDRDNTSFG